LEVGGRACHFQDVEDDNDDDAHDKPITLFKKPLDMNNSVVFKDQ